MLYIVISPEINSVTQVLNISEILDLVIKGEEPPFRPQLPKYEKGEEGMVELMRDCWKEDPNERPDTEDIKKRLKSLNKGKYVCLDECMYGTWAPSQYKDRLIYIWRFPC